MASRRCSPDWLETSAGQTSSPQRTTATPPSNRASHVHSVNTSPAHPEIQIATFTKKQVCAPMGAPPSECFHTGSDQSPQTSCLHCATGSHLFIYLHGWSHTSAHPPSPYLSSIPARDTLTREQPPSSPSPYTTWVGCDQNVSKGERSFYGNLRYRCADTGEAKLFTDFPEDRAACIFRLAAPLVS